MPNNESLAVRCRFSVTSQRRPIAGPLTGPSTWCSYHTPQGTQDIIAKQRSAYCLRIRIANLVFKLLTCLLYIGRVCSDNDPIKAACYDCPQSNKSEFYEASTLTEEEFQETPIINWDAILWVNRPLILWIIQVILAVISLIEALLLAYLGYKVTIITLLWYSITRQPSCGYRGP
uniref:Uncharacterized protein n=1 Tax=Timema cristinae TaxID=61476 RepID=A0A7R9GXM3_TIMCR|nr:unnamed protein product [Timema cristinae]